MQNWKLVCAACAAEFLPGETIDLVDGHYQEDHPDLEKPHFNMVWIGRGPAPRGPRSQSRPRRRR
jgi:hypothetical protein